jgi:allantoin racemase
MINIRVVSPITTKGFRKDSDLIPLGDGLFKVSASQIDIGPASIESEFDEAMCQPDTILKIIEAEKEGCDGVVIDCMGDPGLQAARECVSIPVIGPCETAMHYASMLGHKFSVITVLERLRPQFENQALLYGVSIKLASVKAVDIPVLELENDLDETVKQLAIKSVEAIERDHSSVMIFGCTGLFGCADALKSKLMEKGYDVPVIDPIPLAVQTAYTCAKLKLSQSKHSYPMPPQKEMVGFGEPKIKLAKG